MSALMELNDMREATKRELYRRLVRPSDRLANVAERVLMCGAQGEPSLFACEVRRSEWPRPRQVSR
jgi:hypothetical protein